MSLYRPFWRQAHHPSAGRSLEGSPPRHLLGLWEGDPWAYWWWVVMKDGLLGASNVSTDAQKPSPSAWGRRLEVSLQMCTLESLSRLLPRSQTWAKLKRPEPRNIKKPTRDVCIDILTYSTVCLSFYSIKLLEEEKEERVQNNINPSRSKLALRTVIAKTSIKNKENTRVLCLPIHECNKKKVKGKRNIRVWLDWKQKGWKGRGNIAMA